MALRRVETALSLNLDALGVLRIRIEGLTFMRYTAHYLFSAIVLSIYGGQVCPFIAGLDTKVWIITVIIALSAAYLARLGAIRAYVESAPIERMVNRQFQLDFTLIMTAAVGIAAYNYFYNFFPVGSGLKVILCLAALGFFMSVDTALERERKLYHRLESLGSRIVPTGRFLTLTGKFSLIASLTIIFITAIIALVIARDIVWLSKLDPKLLDQARLSIAVELAFIAIVSLLEALNLILSFSKNLWLFFDAENSTLNAVITGDLSRRVTVSADNEFGVMGHYTNKMIDKLKNYTDEISKTRDVTIFTLASLAETRDNSTGAHLIRTQKYAQALAIEARANPKYRGELTDGAIELLYKSAPLHDIGKVGIPDSILLKPGPLDDKEFEIMKQHTTLGKRALEWAERKLGFNSFLNYATQIAHSHHERWDGAGYPEGLAGERIPLPARLMAIADVYDALISKRVYKDEISHRDAVNIILDGRGTHFDPDIVDAFLRAQDKFHLIATQFADGDTDFDETETIAIEQDRIELTLPLERSE